MLVVLYTLGQRYDLAFVHFHTLEIDNEFHIPDDQASHQTNWHIEHEQDREKSLILLYIVHLDTASISANCKLILQKK